MVLALVFLLVCVLVGVSVLMAAASNAGRSGSNRQEQQYYLALSSALQLVSDDLQESSYVGKMDFDPNAGGKRQYTAQKGDLTGSGMFSSSSGSGKLNTAFRDALDESFDIYIVEYLKAHEASGATYEYKNFATEIADPTITLELTPQGGKLDGYKFQITLTVEKDLNIILKAAITDIPAGAPEMLKSYTMEMELRPAKLPELSTVTEPTTETNNLPATAVTWIADRVTRPIVTPATGG